MQTETTEELAQQTPSLPDRGRVGCFRKDKMFGSLQRNIKKETPNARLKALNGCSFTTGSCSYLQADLQLRLQSLDLVSQQVFAAASLCGLERK